MLGARQRRQGYIEGDGLRITWCVGHLAELAAPQTYDPGWKRWRLDNLPMLPERFELAPRGSARDQWQVVRGQLRDRAVSEVVNACDAGREGELIFAHAYQLAGCDKPVQRLWISSMTDGAIREGFARLRGGEGMRPLEHAARCRAEADWLVGLNATRAMTVRFRETGGGALLSLGRVQTPTLALLCEREDAITAFEPRTYWQVKATLKAEAGTWEATWTRLDARGRPMRPPKKEAQGAGVPDEAWPDRLWQREEAEAVVARLEGHGEGVVHKVVRKDKHEPPPLLYDLTTLQKEANRRFGFTAKRTLEIAQRLYEQHKVLTYPRTDSRHLGSDQVQGLPQVLQGVAFGPYAKVAEETLERWPVRLGKRVVDDAEVSDHHAIIPTGVDPRGARLDLDDKRIFDLVARRFLAVFQEPAVFAMATVDVRVPKAPTEGEPVDCLLARGRTMVSAGWRAIDPPQSKRKELLLPFVEQGQPAGLERARLKEGSTRPPPRYSEATLLAAMERAGEQLEERELARAMKRNGLGTPATRAAIIETLLSRRYVKREAKNLVPTPQGQALIRALPAPQLRSPALTGRWEARLVAMAEGSESRDAFMADVRALTAEVVDAIRQMRPDPGVAQVLSPPEKGGAPLGRCPRCDGGEVRKLRFGWGCSACTLRIPGQVARREVSERMAKALLSEGRTKALKGFKSKAGKTFSAALVIGDDGRVVFDFPDPDPLGACPVCASPVRQRGRIWTCDTGRSCSFVVFGEMSGRQIQEAEVRALLERGVSEPAPGFGDPPFVGQLVMQDGRVRVVRVAGAQAPASGAPAPQTRRGPPPAFGAPLACPACKARGAEPAGHVIAGRRAWGCSKWRAGCRLQVPFEVDGLRVPNEEAQRLFGRHGATRYLKGFASMEGRTARIRLTPGQGRGWQLERRGG